MNIPRALAAKIKRANELSRKTGKVYFVIHELNYNDDWDYIVADLYALDTYYSTTPESRVLHCTA